MAKQFDLERDGQDLFILFYGVRIARRGQPGTPQAGTWVPLEPGFEVADVLENGAPAIEVWRNGTLLH